MADDYVISALIGLGLYTFIIAATSVGALSIYLVYVRRKYAHIPGPPIDNFFFGHIPSLKRCYDRDEYVHNQFLAWAEEFQPVYKIFLLHQVMLIPTSEALIKEFLTRSKYPKSKKAYARFEAVSGTRFLGGGFVTNTDHSSWRVRRNAINPAFHRRHLREMMGRFNAVGDEWINTLRQAADGRTVVSLSKSLCRVTLDAIGKVAFNFEVGALRSVNSPFPNAINKILEAMCILQRDPLYRWKPWYWQLCSEAREAISFLRSFGRGHIEDRLRALQAGDPVPEDVLTYLVKTTGLVDGLTVEDLLDDFDTLFVAGQETTSNTLSFLFGEVGRRPEILQRLREEVHAVLGTETEVRFEHLSHLPYLHQVWQETLRLYPPAPGTARDVLTETTVDGVTFPADSFIVVSFYVVHRLQTHFQDPIEFNPDRFAPGVSRPLFAYLPFSLGHRSCAGQQFAQIESKVLACKFLQSFDYELDPGQSYEVQETTTLRPRGGTRMTLTQRS